jgi:hypothetical protein
MPMFPFFTALVTVAGGMERLFARRTGTLGAAIELAVVAVAADHHLALTARTVE